MVLYDADSDADPGNASANTIKSKTLTSPKRFNSTHDHESPIAFKNSAVNIHKLHETNLELLRKLDNNEENHQFERDCKYWKWICTLQLIVGSVTFLFMTFIIVCFSTILFKDELIAAGVVTYEPVWAA